MRALSLTCAAAALSGIVAAADVRAASDTAGRTTLTQTVVRSGPDRPFDRFELGPGEPRRLRQELATALPGRGARRRSLLYFSHLSDFQLTDEESPGRVEGLDPTTDPAPFAAAWRPQEALGPFAADRALDQVNRLIASPSRQGDGSRARMSAAVITGDAIDNAQQNEAEWLRTLLEGGRLDPNSGTNLAPTCPQEGASSTYTGVQDYDDYAETPDFWDPDVPAGIFAAWPRWSGLMERAQRPFATAGLRVPSYIAYGNHDRLVQGNQAANRSFEDVSTGCLKPTQAFADPRTAFSTITPAYLAQTLMSNPSAVMQVPPDPRRRFLSSSNYKEVMRAGRRSDGHGFGLVDPAEERASNGAAGYYAFSPRPGFRFIVMDATVEAGVAGPGAGGNIDNPQYLWIQRELERAKARDELVITFSHANAATMDTTLEDEIAGPCSGDDGHGHGQNPGCDADPRDSRPIRVGTDMIALFKRYPNVIAWLAGHTHENNLDAYRDSRGGLWAMETASISDNPQQGRLVEVMDNRDGTLSIVGTVFDTSAPTAIPPPGAAGEFSVDQLASLSRTLAFNDPQGALNGRPGVSADRNVELVVRDPRRSACSDRLAPRSRVTRRRLRASRRGLKAAGRSRDRGCVTAGTRKPGRVARVEIAFARSAGRRCRFVTARRRLSRPRSCRRRVWIKARTRYSRRARATVWSVRRARALPRGRYRLYLRARDLLGNTERARGPRRVRVR